MKRITSKLIAVMLVVCMIFPIVPIWAFAGSVSTASAADTVTFKLEKVSEDKDHVTVKLVLAEGKTLCFDAVIGTGDSLTCSAIDYSSELKAFVAENTDSALASNNETERLSFATSVELSAPFDIAEFTYLKEDKRGVVLSDFTLSVDSCYYKNGEGQDIQLGTTVINTIPATHTHVESGVWVETEPATCQHGGQRVMYCAECNEICTVEYTTQTDHTTKTVRVEPTCEKDGYISEVCTSCGQEISRTVLPKTGHKNTVVQHKDATCTEDGYDRVVCNDCNKIISETVIKSPGHKTVVDEKPATCTEDGYYIEKCTVCNEVIINDVLKAPGHKIVVDEKPATCTENGYYKETCSVCKEVLVDKILPATNHANTEVQHKDATCTEDGYDRIFCKDCNQIISETVLKAQGHKTVAEEKDATCTEDGYSREVCSICKEILKNEIKPATGHQHKKTDTLAATCTEDGYIRETCLDCGNVVKETILKANGHKFVNDIKKATCTEDGYVRQQCTVCKTYSGISRVLKATGHAWGKWRVVKEPTYRSVGLRRSTCTNCGEHMDEEIPMIIVPVKKIVISPEEDFTIYCKKSDRLQANVYPEEAAYSAEIVWTSSNPNVLDVSEDGTITAKLRGTATVTASTADGSVTATRKVTVEYTFLQWIIIYILFGWIWYL